jgi:Tol biopolymer transport system component
MRLRVTRRPHLHATWGEPETRILVAAVLGALAFALLPGPGAATVPGRPGLIAVVTTTGLTQSVFSVQPDGTGTTRLPSDPGPTLPAISADGSLIATYTFAQRLWVGRSDGTGEHLLGTLGASPSFSPDGTQLVVVPSLQGLSVVDARTGAARTITTKPVYLTPQWSPDGAWIAYFDNPYESGLTSVPYALHLVRPDGSDDHVVGGNVDPQVGFAWSPDGTRIALRENAPPHQLEVVDVNGNATTYPTQTVNGTPAWSPDGGRIAYGDTPIGPCGNTCRSYLTVLDLATGTMVHLAPDGRQPAWSHDGRLLAYVGDGRLRPVRVIDAVGGRPDQIVNSTNSPAVAWTADGRVIYTAHVEDVPAIELVSSSGGLPRVLPGTAGAVGQPSWSPDGKRIAFTKGSSVAVVNADGSDAHLVPGTDTDAYSADPAWSPDGRHLAYVRNDGVYIVAATGSTPRRIVKAVFPFSPAWSPDGRLIAYGYGTDYGNGSRLGFVRPDGSHNRRVRGGLTQNERVDWSPDGRRLAIVRTLYLCAGCDDPVLFTVNREGNPTAKLGRDLENPSWSPDGSLIAATEPDGTVDLVATDGTRTRLTATGSFPAWQPLPIQPDAAQ